MKPNLLDLKYPNDEPDSVIVGLVADLVGAQLSLEQYRSVIEHLTGEDYTIAERFFPALEYLIQMIRDQPERETRNKMAVTLAVSMRYVLCDKIDLSDSGPATQKSIHDCCRLFLENYLQTADMEDQRTWKISVTYLLE